MSHPRGGTQSWDLQYTSARGLWWFIGAICVLGAAGVVIEGVLGSPAWLQTAREYSGWVIALVMVPMAFVAMRSMMPRKGSIEIDATAVRVAAGHHSVSLSRDRLRLSSKRWEPAAQYEMGVALVLDDGKRSVEVGARDRRLPDTQGVSRAPAIFVEGEVLDQLLPALGSHLAALRPDAPLAPTESLSLELTRNPNSAWPILLMVGGMFGGMLGGGLLAFGLQATFGIDPTFVLAIVVPIAIFGSMITFFTWRRRGKISLTIQGDVVSVGRGRAVVSAPRSTVRLQPGTVSQSARYYGSYETPVLEITVPGRPPVTIGTFDVRLCWPNGTPTVRAAKYLVPAIDFRRVVTALQLGNLLRVDPDVERRKLEQLGGRR